MRMLPFFKPKKGFVVAGGGLDTGGGGGGGSYTLPTATSSRLGGVKIGSGVSVADDGTISVSGGGGGGGAPVVSETEIDTGSTYGNKTVYMITITETANARTISKTIATGLDLLKVDAVFKPTDGGISCKSCTWLYLKNTGVFTAYCDEFSGTARMIATLYYTK